MDAYHWLQTGIVALMVTGACAYLLKHFMPMTVRARIGRALARHLGKDGAPQAIRRGVRRLAIVPSVPACAEACPSCNNCKTTSSPHPATATPPDEQPIHFHRPG